MIRRIGIFITILGLLAGIGGKPFQASAQEELTLLNVSYDPTRELYKDLNAHFIPLYEKQTGTKLKIDQSHGGSSSQARAIIDGLDADVVTIASIIDTDAIRSKGLIKDGWVEELPNRSLPYTSTLVFIVRKDNPKGIKDWSDLIKPGVEVITPNPKTSGNGYLTFFAAWGSVVLRGGSEQDAVDYVTNLYQHVPVLDSGARGATTTFVQKKIGDVNVAWENEANLQVQQSKGELEIVYPPISLLAEPHVTLVDSNVDRKGTRDAAQAYLEFLYSDEGQEIIAKHYYRPGNQAILEKYRDRFPDIKLFNITEIAENFQAAHKRFITDGGVFDTIYQTKKKGS